MRKTDLENVKNTLEQHFSYLQKTYHVKNLGVFGSVATGLSNESSDIDILVEFGKPVGFFQFTKLENYLSQILGKKIDLVTKKALKPAVKEDILKAVSYV